MHLSSDLGDGSNSLNRVVWIMNNVFDGCSLVIILPEIIKSNNSPDKNNNIFESFSHLLSFPKMLQFNKFNDDD